MADLHTMYRVMILYMLNQVGISTDQHTDHELYSGKRIYELFYGSGDSV